MTDYTKTTNFTTKDGLASGDSAKLIKGADHDTEYDAIAVAVATKYDSGNLASQAQAEAATLNTVLMTPLRTENWADTWAAENGGMVGELQALADPGADRIYFWDDGEAADSNVAFLTVGDGIEISTATLQLPASLAGDGVSLASGVLSLTALSSTTTNPMAIASGVPDIELETLTTIEGNALAATDTFLVDDGGVPKGIEVQDAGLRAQTAQATQTLAAADMNSIMEFTATATLTLPLNSSVALPIGTPIILNMKHATQELTITAATSVTLVSVYHPGGGSAASDTLIAGGTAVLYKTAADVWALSGDITT